MAHEVSTISKAELLKKARKSFLKLPKAIRYSLFTILFFLIATPFGVLTWQEFEQNAQAPLLPTFTANWQVAGYIQARNNIVFFNEQPFVMHGLNMIASRNTPDCKYGSASNPFGEPLQAEAHLYNSDGNNELQILRNTWHINTIRLQIDESALNDTTAVSVIDPGFTPPLPTNLTEQQYYTYQLERDVSLLESAHIVPILAMWMDDHNKCDIHSTATSTFTDIYTGSPTATTLSAWQYLAPLFATDQKVVFELYNEPHIGFTHGVPNDPLISPTASEWSTWQSDEQTLLNGIRSVGARNLVIVDGPKKAVTFDGIIGNGTSSAGIACQYCLSEPIENPGYGIAYAVHPYTFQDHLNKTKTINNVATKVVDKNELAKCTGTNTSNCIWNTEFGDLSKIAPVVATEWDYSGTQCDTGPAIASVFFSYLNTRNIGLVPWVGDSVSSSQIVSHASTNNIHNLATAWTWDPTECASEFPSGQAPANYPGGAGHDVITLFTNWAAKSTPQVLLSLTQLQVTTTSPVTLLGKLIYTGSIPTGNIQLKDNGASEAIFPIQSDGTFTIPPQLFTQGIHKVTILYLGDQNYLAQLSNPVTFTSEAPVSTTTTSTTLSYLSSSTTLNLHYPTCYDATVSNSDGTVPLGTIIFKDKSQTLGIRNITQSTQTANLCTSSLPDTTVVDPTISGTETVTAVFTPTSATYQSSTSSPVVLTILKDSSQTSIKASAGSGGTNTCPLATVTVKNFGGPAKANGHVTISILDDAGVLHSQVATGVVTSGVSTFSLPLVNGNNKITATYTDDVNFYYTSSAGQTETYVKYGAPLGCSTP